MPTIFKCTIFFEGPNHGWTESYWYSGTSDSYQNAMFELQDLCKFRAPLLGVECYIKAQRVSQVNVLGDSYLQEIIYPGTTQEPACEPDAAVLCHLQDLARSKRKAIFLRGSWDSVESDSGVYLRNRANWLARMDAFKTVFSDPTNSWGWMGVATKTTAFLTTYTVLPTQQIQFTFSTELFPAGMEQKIVQVRFQGINGKSNLNGLQVVKILSRTSCVTFLPISNVPYQFGGKATYATQAFIDGKRLVDQRITTRKVGAPLLVSRGRQRARPRT